MFSSIHWACCFTLLSILPTSKIEMAAFCVMATLFGMFPFFKSCSPTAAIRGRNSDRASQSPAPSRNGNRQAL